jgi:Tn3 transposase DDE domain
VGSVWRGRRDRRKPPKEQRKIIKFNHLLTNCLILYNVFVISKELQQLTQEGLY